MAEARNASKLGVTEVRLCASESGMLRQRSFGQRISAVAERARSVYIERTVRSTDDGDRGRTLVAPAFPRTAMISKA